MKSLIARLKTLAVDQPNTEAVVSNGYSINYAQLVERIENVASEIQRIGFDRLAVYAGNDLDWLLIDLAAASLAIPVVPIPLFFSHEQREHLLVNSGVDGVYCGQGTIHLSGSALRSDLLAGSYRRLSPMTHSDPVSFSKVTYTSGSTGTPKGACLSGDTLLTIVSSLADALEPSQLGRHLCLLPFATLLENVAGIYLPLWMGRSLVIEDNERIGLLSNHAFDATLFCTAVARHAIESVILLPQMLKVLIEHGDVASLTSLKFIAVGGGKVPPELLEQALLMGLPVYEGYGLTECGSCVALNTPGALRIGSVGKPLCHAQVRIADTGEIYVTGAAMDGYLDADSATCEIATGDAGYIDGDGFLYITGRIKNTIISSFGRNISPEWVESVFLAEPEIQQIAVFGEADPYLSAVIYAPKEVSDDELKQVILRVNSKLPDYARAEVHHRTHRAFTALDGTLTANGKLYRGRIAEIFAQEINNAQQEVASC